MVIGFPKCNFKCEKECAEVHCQNKQLALQPDIQIDIDKLCERYINNPITKAIVCAGLEPFDSIDDLLEFMHGPDFPTGGIVQGLKGIREAFETGKGKVIVRSKTAFDCL